MIRRFIRSGVQFVLPTIVVCLALLEGGLRFAGRMPSNITEGLFEQHGTAYRLRKNLTKVSRTPSFTATVHTNALGLRDKAPGPRVLGAVPYIAWVGDSITFGNGVEYEDSFVGVFGAKAARQHIEVVNLAVGGYHLAESEELLSDFLDATPRAPAEVIYVFTPQTLASFEESYKDVTVKDGYIFQGGHWLRAWLVIKLGNGSAAYCFFRDSLRKIQARLFPAGPGATVQALDMYAVRPADKAEAFAARFEARLAQLEARVRKAGSKLVYAYVPSSVDLRAPGLLSRSDLPASGYDFNQYRDLLRRHAARASVDFIDLDPMLHAEAAKGKQMCFLQDPHYNAEMNRLIGEELYRTLIATDPQVSVATP